ncbi:hypothetical protein D3C86_2119470 [compost metagenome]
MLLGQKHEIVHCHRRILGEQLYGKAAFVGVENSLIGFAGVDGHRRRLGPAFGRALGR